MQDVEKIAEGLTPDERELISHKGFAGISFYSRTLHSLNHKELVHIDVEKTADGSVRKFSARHTDLGEAVHNHLKGKQMTNDKDSAVRQANREWEVSDFYDDREMANWARAWGVDLLEAATTGQPTQSDALREVVIEECAKALEADAMKCDCAALEERKCGCGAWCEWKSITSARAVEIVRELKNVPPPEGDGDQ